MPLLNLIESRIETPLGLMKALADESALYFLGFHDVRNDSLNNQKNGMITVGRTCITDLIERELTDYFSGTLKQFSTPLKYSGTEFQTQVWRELKKIPYGETRSYAKVAQAINKPSAIRAGASANAKNQLAIVIPCHRVINANGNVGGYAGGIERKKWLLEHERIYLLK